MDKQLQDRLLFFALIFSSIGFASLYFTNFAITFLLYLALSFVFINLWFTQKRDNLLIEGKKLAWATHLTLIVGILEAFLFISLLYIYQSTSGFLGELLAVLAFWLTFRAATQWESWKDENTGRARQHLFLIGEVLNFSLALVAFLSIQHLVQIETSSVLITLPLTAISSVVVLAMYVQRQSVDNSKNNRA